MKAKNEQDPYGPQGIPDAWWSHTLGDLIRLIGVNLQHGLSTEQVEQNRLKYGSNTLQDLGPSTLWKLFWESIKSPMRVLLLSIAGISLAFGQVLEAIVMVVVVSMYVGIHLLNRARSDRTMARLRELQVPRVTLLRDDRSHDIPINEVVVGDVLLLQAGSMVAADARLIHSTGLIVNEGPLTGESAPINKNADAEVMANAPLAERPTAVFAETTVLDGQGAAMVMTVGTKTELGKVTR